MEIASSHLHCSLQEAQHRIPSSEFVLWKLKIEKDLNKHEKLDYYLAQLAREVRAVLAKNPEKIKLVDFLITFVTPNFKSQKKEAPKLTEEQKRNQMELHKNMWRGIVGGVAAGKKLLGIGRKS